MGCRHTGWTGPATVMPSSGLSPKLGEDSRRARDGALVNQGEAEESSQPKAAGEMAVGGVTPMRLPTRQKTKRSKLSMAGPRASAESAQ